MDKILAGFRKIGRAAFSTGEYSALLGRRGYARVALHRLKKRGKIENAKRGWWAFANSTPEEVACTISAPAYLSFHSALHMHGLTTQIPRTIQVAVARNAKKYEISGNHVAEYKIRPEHFNNYEAKDGVLLATPEKALADCLNVPRACTKTVLLEAAEQVDLKKAEWFLTRTGKKRLKQLEKELKKARKND